MKIEKGSNLPVWPPSPDHDRLLSEMIENMIADAMANPPVDWLVLTSKIHKETGISVGDAYEVVTRHRHIIEPDYKAKLRSGAFFPILVTCFFIFALIIEGFQERGVLASGTAITAAVSLQLLRKR